MKDLKAKREYDEADFLQLSGVQHFVFCRRQWALIAIEQVWIENYLTFDGRSMHENAHEGLKLESRGDLLITRGLPICSKELGLTGQCDIVEFHKSQEIEAIGLPGHKGKFDVVPVEYKRGKVKVGLEDVMQVVAQAIALEEMLATNISTAYIYYGSHRRRQEISITDALREQLSSITKEMHQYLSRAYVPRVRYQKKCDACSLKDYCQPLIPYEQKVEDYLRGFLNEKIT